MSKEPSPTGATKEDRTFRADIPKEDQSEPYYGHFPDDHRLKPFETAGMDGARIESLEAGLKGIQKRNSQKPRTSKKNKRLKELVEGSYESWCLETNEPATAKELWDMLDDLDECEKERNTLHLKNSAEKIKYTGYRKWFTEFNKQHKSRKK